MRQFFDGYRLLYICQGLERQNMPDHVEQLNGPEDGRGSLLPSVCSFGHSTGRYLFCLCSLNLVTSASLLYPSEKPGSLGMTPCFSHPFGGNHKFLLRCYTLTFFFFFGCAGSSLLHTGFSVFAMSAGFSWASVLNAHGLGSCHCWALENRLDSCGTRA